MRAGNLRYGPFWAGSQAGLRLGFMQPCLPCEVGVDQLRAAVGVVHFPVAGPGLGFLVACFGFGLAGRGGGLGLLLLDLRVDFASCSRSSR